MKQTRILIVDDDVSIRKLLRANLEARDYEVLQAANGEEALEKIKEKMPDLILLDISMPGMDGFEVCRRVRGNSKIPIIMLTARYRDDDIVKYRECGADAYLTKPFELNNLLTKIKSLLERIE